MANPQDMHAWIMARFDEGRSVTVATYLSAITYKPKHRAMFRLRGNDVEVQSGRRWLSIKYCGLRAH